jgi:carboxyl-terminal processing protease
MLQCLMVNKTHKILWTAMGAAIGLSFGLARGVLAEKPAELGKDLPWQDARMLAEVLDRVEHDYVNPVDDHQLLQAAIRGMVSSLDPYSAYLDGDEYDEIKISSSGQYSGVGIEVSMEDEQVVVVSPFEGSAAAAAGIKTGDVIASIDGVPVNTANLADTIGKMRGKEGTSVTIGILRQGSTEPLEFTLKRSRVELHSVKSELLERGYGYVRIAEFSETTGDDTVRALREMRRKSGGELKGLVLDMRNNPGGVLEAAVAVADAPMVVLVNGGSASAAEIVAGALKDHRRATLMGRTTFGKGSVQTVMPLSGDRAIKLTTSLYYTPSGVSINHRGIAPDIELERDPKTPEVPVPDSAPLEQRDPEVRRAVQELKAPTVGRSGSVSAALRMR